jgi:hypothetical protein
MLVRPLLVLGLLAGAGLLAPLRAAEPPAWKFSFAPGAAPAGYVQVAPGVAYGSGLGYGFEPGSAVTEVDIA